MTAASMVCRRTRVVTALLASVLGLPAIAQGATFGNLTYTQAELEKPVSFFGGDGADKFPSGPNGSNTALVLHGYMIVMGSYDSGKPPGSFHTYDLTDPRKPKLVHTLDGTPETANLRELHAMPIAMIDGKDYLVVPSTSGLQFFDFTDPLNPKPSGKISLKGVAGGDYDNAAWMLSWAWPYVFAAGTGNGLYIVDATDPANPKELPKVASPDLGNFRIGPVYAAGNYVVAAQMDQAGTKFAVVDVGDPNKPFLSGSGSTPDSLYSALVIGDRIYGAGADGTYSFLKWTPDVVSVVHRDKNGTDRGGYCGYTDGFVICGQSSEGYKKWDVRNEAAIKLAGHGTDPEAAGGDFDFATALGNLVYLGNDHGSGAALIPHQMGADTTAPKIAKIYPVDGDVKQPLTTRITVFFTDDIDLDTVLAKNIVVRKNGDCMPLSGVFSKSSFNAISFGSKTALAADATYDVVVPAGGIKDLAGNAVAVGAVAHFSTGASIEPVMACPGDGDVAGPGNEGGSSAGGAAGSGGMVSAAGTGTVVVPVTAGSSSTGGVPSVGGSDAGSGGMSPAGSSAGSTTTPTAAPSTDAGGCGCSVPGRAPLGTASLLLAGLAWLGARRGRARRQRNRAGLA